MEDGTVTSYPTSLSSVLTELPPTKEPQLINELLRRCQKMMIAAPSKSFKTSLAIYLAISIAEGKQWLGHDCMQGKVLYVNLNETANMLYAKFSDVYSALGWEMSNTKEILVHSLPGKHENLAAFFNQIKEVAKGEGYKMIIFDSIDYILDIQQPGASIYINQALDDLCKQLGVCTVFTTSRQTNEDTNADSLYSLCDTTFEFIITKSTKNKINKKYRCEVYSRNSKESKTSQLYTFEYPVLVNQGSYASSIIEINKQKHQKAIDAAIKAYDELSANGESVTVEMYAKYLGIQRPSVYRKINNTPGLETSNGEIIKVTNDEDE